MSAKIRDQKRKEAESDIEEAEEFYVDEQSLNSKVTLIDQEIGSVQDKHKQRLEELQALLDAENAAIEKEVSHLRQMRVGIKRQLSEQSKRDKKGSEARSQIAYINFLDAVQALVDDGMFIYSVRATRYVERIRGKTRANKEGIKEHIRDTYNAQVGGDISRTYTENLAMTIRLARGFTVVVSSNMNKNDVSVRLNDYSGKVPRGTKIVLRSGINMVKNEGASYAEMHCSKCGHHVEAAYYCPKCHERDIDKEYSWDEVEFKETVDGKEMEISHWTESGWHYECSSCGHVNGIYQEPHCPHKDVLVPEDEDIKQVTLTWDGDLLTWTKTEETIKAGK